MFKKKFTLKEINKKNIILTDEIISNVFNYKLPKLFNIIAQKNLASHAESLLNNKMVFPNLELLVDFDTYHDWELKSVKVGRNTALLWQQSLYSVLCLCVYGLQVQKHEYIHKAIEFFISWSNWTKSSNTNQKMAFQMDHAVSNRVIAMCELNNAILECKIDVGDGFKKEIIEFMLHHTYWLIKDENYFKNNHGVMTDRAILVMVVKFGIAINVSEWSNKAITRLNEMFELTFDKDGVSTENSPSYHMLNLTLYQNIIDFIDFYDIDVSNVAQFFKENLKKSTTVASFMLREDGNTPNIGDSEVNKYPKFPNLFGTVCYPESGFAIIKKKHLYFSLKCGGKSLSHKHVDDTSITLRYAGKDIIVDGGNFNYDRSDTRSHNSLSYVSHSGLFTEDFKSFRIRDYSVQDYIDKTSLSMVHNSNQRVSFRAENNLVQDIKIIREIHYVHPKQLIIIDEGSSSKNRNWVQKFLLHPDTKIISQDKLTLNCIIDNVEFSIKQFSTSNYELSLSNALYVERFMVGRECNVVNFNAVSQNIKFCTIITMKVCKSNLK